MRTKSWKNASLALSLCALVGAVACDDDTTDSPDTAAQGGRVARAGSGAKAGAGGDSASSAGKGGSAAQAGASGSGDGACFSGEPSETKQFLDRCTDSECEPFDNAKRLPLLKDGKLPALP